MKIVYHYHRKSARHHYRGITIAATRLTASAASFLQSAVQSLIAALSASMPASSRFLKKSSGASFFLSAIYSSCEQTLLI